MRVSQQSPICEGLHRRRIGSFLGPLSVRLNTKRNGSRRAFFVSENRFLVRSSTESDYGVSRNVYTPESRSFVTTKTLRFGEYWKRPKVPFP